MPITLTDDMRAEMRKAAEDAQRDRERVHAGDDRGEKLWGNPDILAAFHHASQPAHVLALLDERDRLERERDEARSDEALRAMEAMQAEAALAVERERVRELRAALEPFAMIAENDIQPFECDEDLYRPFSYNIADNINVGHLRRAARLLASYSEDGA